MRFACSVTQCRTQQQPEQQQRKQQQPGQQQQQQKPRQEDELYDLTFVDIGGRTSSDYGAGWPSIPGGKVVSKDSWMDGNSSNHLTILSNSALGLCTLVKMLHRIAEERSSNLPMRSDMAVHTNDHVINKAGLHLWMQVHVANSVELDDNATLKQISAKLFRNGRTISMSIGEVLRAFVLQLFRNDEVMITTRGTAMQLEFCVRVRLLSERLVCLTVCSACNISCRHEPWPKGSVLSTGWQRELLKPSGIVIIINVK